MKKQMMKMKIFTSDDDTNTTWIIKEVCVRSCEG